jgi:hypothetical protein
MHSKNKKHQTEKERDHVARIKAMPCICCVLLERAAGGPTEVHEIKQGSWFLSIPLDWQCHRGPGGIHGDKTYLRILKMDELDLLNETYRRLEWETISTKIP